MAEIRIFEKEDDHGVILKGNINTFKDYQNLKDELFKAYAKKPKKTINLKIDENFILSFKDIKGKDNNELFIPNEISEGIWDNKTFRYFKEKLQVYDIQKATYKFYIKKVKKLPRWKRKENNQFLKEDLESSWNKIFDNITKEINSLDLEESKANYNRLKSELAKNEEILNKQIHKKIICNNCLNKDFKGKRFICAECDNFNLCQDCEKIFYLKQIHPRDHTLIQVNKALNKENLEKSRNYNNIIGNNNQELKNVPTSFQVDISIINSGENDLQNCYIIPIRYGENNITCYPRIIKEEIQRNMNIKLSLVLRLPNDSRGLFEGYFRMFTPDGLPFGSVLCVKVLNGN